MSEFDRAAPTPGPSRNGGGAGPEASPQSSEWPLWEVFVRSKSGLDHKHCGSLHAADPKMAIQLARDVYTRRQEGTSVWVVRSDQIVASDPSDKDMYFDPMEDKVYRHSSFSTCSMRRRDSSLLSPSRTTQSAACCWW